MTDSSANDGSHASSDKPGCAALVKLLNADHLSGSKAHASVGFDGGQDGGFIGQDLDAFATPTAAAAFVGQYRSAVKGCRSLSYTIPGTGSSTIEAREISFAKIGDDSFAARFDAYSGALDGFEISQAAASLGPVVLTMFGDGLAPDDLEAATQAAADKAHRHLPAGRSI